MLGFPTTHHHCIALLERLVGWLALSPIPPFSPALKVTNYFAEKKVSFLLWLEIFFVSEKIKV